MASGGQPDDDWGDAELDAEQRAALQRAEAALAEMQQTATTAFAEDLDRARTAYAAAIAEPERGGEKLQEVFDAAHCIKGLGTTFDFDLLTEIGRRLCEVLKHRPAADSMTLGLVAAHLQAMGDVLERDLRGDGGAEGSALLAGLPGDNPAQ